MNNNLSELEKNRCIFCGDRSHTLLKCEYAQKEINRLYNASVYHRNKALRNQDELYLLKWFSSLKIVELQYLYNKISQSEWENNSPNRENKIQKCMDFFYYKYSDEINY